jgi:hypothetical protein
MERVSDRWDSVADGLDVISRREVWEWIICDEK